MLLNWLRKRRSEREEKDAALAEIAARHKARIAPEKAETEKMMVALNDLLENLTVVDGCIIFIGDKE